MRGFFGSGSEHMGVEQSGGPETHPQWPNPPVDVNGVRTIIAGWLTEKCSNLVATMLAGVATKKNPVLIGGNLLDLFDAIAEKPNGGFQRGKPPDGQGSLGGGTIRGRVGKGATICHGRDFNGSDDATFRRYNRWHARFDQPDPYEGSYDLADSQSLNRYAYVQGDPVNLVALQRLI